MLNAIERRQLAIAQNDVNLQTVIPPDTLVVPYGYVLELGTVSATDNKLTDQITQSGIITIQSDAYFIMQYLTTGVIWPTGTTGIGGNTLHISPSLQVAVQITDTGSGHELYNQAIFGGIGGGTPLPHMPGVPYLFSVPRVIAPNTNIKIEATQFGAVIDNPEPLAFYFMINGVKVFV